MSKVFGHIATGIALIYALLFIVGCVKERIDPGVTKAETGAFYDLKYIDDTKQNVRCYYFYRVDSGLSCVKLETK